MNSYQFDFDLGLSSRSSSSSRPLKDQKPNPVPSAAKRPSAAAASWAHQPSTKPSWTHQPAPRSGLPNPPTSMVGDISGKSWTSAAPSSTSHIGIPDKNPKLFGDLVGSVLGQPKVSGGGGGANAPLKAAGPRNSYSMGSLSDSLPKSTGYTAATNNPVRPSWGSADNLKHYPSSNQGGDKIGIPMGGGGPSMKSNPASQTNPRKDPFESLMGFGSKNSMKPPSFQNAKRDDFGNLAQGFPAPPVNSSDHLSGTGDDYTFGAFKNAKFDDIGIPAQSFPAPTDRQEPLHSKTGADPWDMLFSSTTSTAPATMAPSGESPKDEWDIGSGSVGGNGGDEGTTELEGLPPPPAGVTATMAKTKGLDYYKQGQHPDAVKWLSWAVFLFEKSGNNDATVEVLSCRASCYKEIANYKKAVADCSKVLEHDNMNVSVLLQRALLYESLEKYKLGAEDLRTVLKIEPHNRLANSTIHRMNKFSG